jgi:glycine/D-amino acid oxidase-like deaminating enzyme
MLTAPALLPLAAHAAEPAPRQRICVIGAGIMGTSLAYHLARRGAAVTVLERATPGAGATQGAFAMLIATHEDDEAFNALYGIAVADWRRLELELGSAVRIQWGGTLTWAPPGAAGDTLAATTRKLEGWGSAVRAIDAAELQRLVPGVVPGPFGAGNFSPNQGTLDPMQALGVIETAARRAGVAFRYPCEVEALRRDGAGRIVAAETTAGPVEADIFVLAAGAATPDLAAALGVKTPIDVVSGSLAHSVPHPPVLGRVLNGPAGSLKQDPDGRIVFGPDYRPGANGKDVSRAYGKQLLADAAKVMPALAGARLEAMTVGYVPIPKDSHPIVGFCAAPSNLYVALTMSGVTMAPLMGRLAASEIVDRIPVDLLTAYRPGRFT